MFLSKTRWILSARSHLARKFSNKPESGRYVPTTSMLRFDSSGKALVFEHAGGETALKWYVRGIAMVTILSSYLAYAEIADPRTI